MPPVNAVLEPELYEMGPKGVSFHTARFILPEATGTVKNIESAAEDIEQRAFKLLPRVDLIVVGVTAPSFIGGVGWDEKMAKTIENSTGLPVLTTSTAVIQALRQLKIRSISVGNPYLEAMQPKLREFLEGNGFKVVAMKTIRNLIGEGKGSAYLQPDIPSETIYKLAKDVDRPEAEGIFISCTNIRTISIIDSLERELRKPVITSSQATMWAILNKLHLAEPREGYGRLLTMFENTGTVPTS